MYFINVIIALTTNLLYFIQSGVADSQIDCNNVRKKDFCWKLILLQSLSSFEPGAVYLIIDTYYFVVVLLLCYPNV